MQVGPYTVEQSLGAGGMSQVWLAREADGQRVVLKRQLNPTDDDRLREEGRIGLSLRHIGVVQTFDVIEHQGRPLLVLEYVPGAPLNVLRTRARLPPAAVCCIGADVAAGLAALHAARDADGRPLRALHRDVTPANIIVSPDGRARLIDLGIARADASLVEKTGTGALRGTVRYLAPELFDEQGHSSRSDLWALGVCLFEAALGRPAIGGSETQILGAIVRGTLLDLRPGEQIAPPLFDVITRLCAPVERRLDNAMVASTLLKQAELACGNGRAEAAVVVYAALDDEPVESSRPVVRPAPVDLPPAPDNGADDNPFARFAASTYCGVGEDAADDDLFGPGPPTATVVTPMPLRMRGPASDPGGFAIHDEAWDDPPLPSVPSPTSPTSTSLVGPGDASSTSAPPDEGAPLVSPPSSSSLPVEPAAGGPSPSLLSAAPIDPLAGHDELDALRRSSGLSLWPVAAAVIVVILVAAALLLKP